MSRATEPRLRAAASISWTHSMARMNSYKEGVNSPSILRSSKGVNRSVVRWSHPHGTAPLRERKIQAVLEAAGGTVRTLSGEPFRYGKFDAGLRNPGFIARGQI